MKNYLLYSTLIAIFTESLYIEVGFDFKLIYIIVFINYFVIQFARKKITIPKYWLYSLIYIALTGVLTIFLYQNQLSGIAFQVFGISFMSIYFYNFFLCYDFDVVEIFEKYCNICYIISLIGIPLFFICYAIDPIYRLHSVMQEPAHFAGIVLPAFYYYMINYKKFKLKFFVVFGALLLSISSIGYIGMLIGLIMIKRKVSVAVSGGLLVLAVIIGFLAYTFIDNVKSRADDTITVINNMDITGTNASTYALAANAYVTTRVLGSNFLIGHGIGSHPISFRKYLYEITGIESFEYDENLLFINSTDAASLAMRTLSELGIIGLFGIIYFIVKNYAGTDNYITISRAILIYFLYKLFREGHYFSPEMYFFVFAYYFVKIKSKRPINALQPEAN